MAKRMTDEEIDSFIKSKSVTQDNYVAPTVKTHVAPAMSVVSQQSNTVRPTVSMPTVQQSFSTQQPLQTTVKPTVQTEKKENKKKAGILKTALKTAGNIATNMGEGALRTGESVLDTLNDIADAINNPLTYLGNKAAYGKDVAKKALKESEKKQTEFIKRDLVNEMNEATGWNAMKDKWEQDSLVKSGNLGGQVAQGVGGMVPALLAGQYLGFNPNTTSLKGLSGAEKAKAIAGNVAKTYASQLPANAVLAASSYGSGLQEGLNEGATRNRARIYGLTDAAIEQASEMLTGGIPGLEGKGGLDQFVEPLINRNTNGYLNALLRAGYGSLGEGLEETIGTYLSALSKKGILGKDIDWNEVNKEALRSGLIGGATGAILNAPANIQNIQDVRTENQLRNALGDAEYAEGSSQYNPDYKGWETQREENRIKEEGTQEENRQRRQEVERVNQERIQEEARKAQELAQERQKEQERIREQERQKTLEESRIKQQERTEKENDYNKYYKRANLDKFDNNVVSKAKEIVQSNKQGRRTKQQWLDIADNIGMQLRGQDADTIKKYAYESFKYERPNVKENLNRQGQKYVSFKVDEWVNAVENAANQSSPDTVQSSVEDTQQATQTETQQNNGLTPEQQRNLKQFRDAGMYASISKEQFLKNNYYPRLEQEIGLTREQAGEWFDNSKTKEYKQLNDKMQELYRKDIVKKNIPLEERGDFVFNAYDKNLSYNEMEKKLEDAVYSRIQKDTVLNMAKNQAKNFDNKEEFIKKWYNKEGDTELGISKDTLGDIYDNQVAKTSKEPAKNLAAKVEEPVLRVEKAKKEITNNLNEAIKGNKTQDFQTMKNNIEKETGRKMRSWVETSTKATGQTELVNSMNKEKITYEPTSNKKNLDNANKELAGLTYEQKLEKAKAIINSDKRLKSTDIALLETVTQESLKEGKMDDFMNLVQETAILGTESGQVVQALSLIRQSDPMTQIDTLKKLIEKEQTKGNKVYQGVEIKEDLVEKVMDSYKKDGTWNREQFDEAMDELKQDIANQMNVRPSEKLNAWRYLSMLGNPKTHIRNIVANIAMGGLQKGKNTIAASIETIAPINKLNKLLGGSETATRGKTLEKSTQEVKNYANNAIDNYFAEHKQKSKYNETMGNLKGELESRRKIFNDKNQVGKMLNKLEKANSNALDIEDVVFNKATTKKAFSNFLTANGIETQQDIENNPEIVAQGLEYAIFKGQEATFHQYSQTGTTLRNARESLRQGSNLTRIVGLGMDATMPFINTPLNIAKTGIEYTPGLGMIKTISDVNNASMDMKADVLIDSISKQFAGGSLAAIGYFLAKAGILNGKGGDEKKDKLEKNLGKQDYSINIGDNTYDLSWLSPSAMPLFVGVELEKTLKGKQGIGFNTVMDALTKTIDPLSEMSVVSSITDALQSYSQGTQALQDISTSAFTSYISQYFPTLLGQIATLFDEKQRSSYGQTTTEKLINQIKYKIPGLKNTLPEQVTTWGDEKKNSENVLIRAAEAFLSPANRKEVKIDDTTREIERIYDNTGSGLPSLSLTKSPKIDSDYVGLNSDEYTQYKKDYGKTSKKLLDELVELKNYKEATDEEKRKMISAIYDYSTYMARKKIADDKDIKYEYKQSDGTGYNYPKYYLSLNVDSFAEYVAEKYNKEEE